MSLLEMDACPALRGVLRLANPQQQVLADGRHRLSVPKVRAFIKVLQLFAKRLNQLRFGKPVHCDE